MKTLELKHIAPYLPYGLKCRLNKKGKFNLDEEYPQPHNEVCRITNLFIDTVQIEISDDDIEYGLLDIDEVDILLRPLSDLAKEIEIDGKRFVPLVELAKIEGLIDIADASPKFNYLNLEDCKVFGVAFNIENDNNDAIIEVLGYDTKNGFGRHIKYEVGEPTFHIVGHQYQLFEKLFEWKFDVFCLIEQGLAIDLNTIK